MATLQSAIKAHFNLPEGRIADLRRSETEELRLHEVKVWDPIGLFRQGVYNFGAAVAGGGYEVRMYGGTLASPSRVAHAQYNATDESFKELTLTNLRVILRNDYEFEIIRDVRYFESYLSIVSDINDQVFDRYETDLTRGIKGKSVEAYGYIPLIPIVVSTEIKKTPISKFYKKISGNDEVIFNIVKVMPYWLDDAIWRWKNGEPQLARGPFNTSGYFGSKIDFELLAGYDTVSDIEQVTITLLKDAKRGPELVTVANQGLESSAAYFRNKRRIVEKYLALAGITPQTPNPIQLGAVQPWESGANSAERAIQR